MTETLKYWPIITPKDQPKSKDIIPFASAEDIGRRIIRRNDCTGWSCIGVVITFLPMIEVRTSHTTIQGEIGDDIQAIHKQGYSDKWNVIYGDGTTMTLNSMEYVHQLQLYNKVHLSAELRNSLKLKPDMLDYQSLPPGFTSTAPTTLSAPTPAPTTTSSTAVPTTSNLSTNVIENDGRCGICHSTLDNDKLVTCQKCPSSYHVYCLTPPLLSVPRRPWTCPSCSEIYTCIHCNKQFKSKPGHTYHIRNSVCIVKEYDSAEESQGSKRIDKQVILTSRLRPNRPVVSSKPIHIPGIDSEESEDEEGSGDDADADLANLNTTATGKRAYRSSLKKTSMSGSSKKLKHVLMVMSSDDDDSSFDAEAAAEEEGEGEGESDDDEDGIYIIILLYMLV